MSKNQFDWIPFYEEFADKLLAYKDNRQELIEKIKQVYEVTGIKLPRLERNEDGENEIIDIDPFTTFGLFNKQITDAINNIFPVIYTDSRKNLVDFFISLDEGNHKKEDLWNIYKYGLLSKSLDWKYQKEWRLLTYENAKKDYNYRFFDINKIYLGCKMNLEFLGRVL